MSLSPDPPSTFTDEKPLPKALIFDLDYTLWPLWVDTHVTPPLKSVSATEVQDRYGDTYGFYSDVPSLLEQCRERGIKTGIASRTHAPDLARNMLDLLRIGAGGGNKGRPSREFFDAMEIYPSDKTRHMNGLHKKLGVEFADMLFFDDETRNANVERELGVCFKLVRDGVTRKEVDAGVEKWRKKHGHT